MPSAPLTPAGSTPGNACPGARPTGGPDRRGPPPGHLAAGALLRLGSLAAKRQNDHFEDASKMVARYRPYTHFRLPAYLFPTLRSLYESHGMRAILPHPGPLPLGEGTAGNAAGCLADSPANPAPAFAERRTIILPLPAGEGGGEGERPPRSARAPNAKANHGVQMRPVDWSPRNSTSLGAGALPALQPS